MTFGPGERAARQPVFNLPAVVVILLAGMAVVHVVRVYVLGPEQSDRLILNLAFFPAAFSGAAEPAFGVEPGGEFWTFVTYALLHGNFFHLILNGIWLAAFGSPLAWRFGALRFLLFSAATAAAGAAAYLVVHPGENAVLVGASAAVSGYMAAASRFLFIGGGPLPRNYFAPAAPLSVVFTDRRTLLFVGVWFAINLASGLAGGGFGSDIAIAWEAHIGGFVAGLLLFPLFDPAQRPSPPADEPGDRRAA